MFSTPILFRLSAGVAIAALLLGTTPPRFAAAQPAPPPQGAPTAPSQGDPPARVGRLALITGTVSFRTADADHWDPATANYPLTSGNSIWTEPQANADIEVGPSRLTLDGATEFDFDRLDDHELAGTLPQGRLYLRLRDPAPGDTLTLRTPRGTVSIAAAGRYLVIAGDATAPTQVTTVEGTAQVYAEGLSLTVGAGQTATINGGEPFAGSIGPRVADPFLDAQIARERPPRVAAAMAPPPAVVQMTGSEPLLATGEWAQEPEAGPVWYPPVAQDWVPYRDGRWVWVSPWGWTWVDAAPWGFAPFHYGRWARYHGRWGWVPGVEPGPYYGPPVYAPALVNWVDVAAGAAVGLAIGAAVGWIPLGPREPYRPWYRASSGYFGRLNGPHVATMNFNTTNGFINRGAGSFGRPGGVAGDPRFAGHWQGMTPQMLAAARPVAQVPVRPTKATPGVTPAVARQVLLAPAPSGFGPRPIAPGPAVLARPGGANASFPLRGPGPGGAAGAATFRPGGLPPLATPGAGRPVPAVTGPALTRPGAVGILPGQPPHAVLPPPTGGVNPALVRPNQELHPTLQHPTPSSPALVPHAPPPPLPAVHTPPAPVLHAPPRAPEPAFHPPPHPAPQPHFEPAHAAPAFQPPPQHVAPPPPQHPAEQHRTCPPGRPNC